MPDNYFLGIDFGTQSVRVGIVDTDGKIISESVCEYLTEHPKSGWATQKPGDWWNCFITAAKTTISRLSPEQKSKIQAATVCATSSTVVMLDDRGNPMGDALLWMDIRDRDQNQRINQTRAPILKQCGGEVSTEWLLPKVLWIKENWPDEYRRSSIILEQLDYINFCLSGIQCASACNAVCKSNFDIERGFDPDFMTQIGLPDYAEKLVTNILPLGTRIGKFQPEVLNEIGLSGKTINLYQGGIDAHVAMFGMGVVTTNRMAMIMGTSFVQFVLSETRPELSGIWGPYKGAMGGPEYLLECGQISAGSIVKWFKQISQIKGENPYDIMMNEAAEVEIGANGLRVLDYFQGNRTPYKNPDARGVIYGLTLQHGRAQIYRAILESVACGTRLIVDTFEKNNIQIDQITICGGVTRDTLWLQIIADVTGKNLVINESSHAGGILGCAMIAAVGEGIFTGYAAAASEMTHVQRTIHADPINHRRYESVYNDYMKLYQLLEPMSSQEV